MAIRLLLVPNDWKPPVGPKNFERLAISAERVAAVALCDGELRCAVIEGNAIILVLEPS